MILLRHVAAMLKDTSRFLFLTLPLQIVITVRAELLRPVWMNVGSCSWLQNYSRVAIITRTELGSPAQMQLRCANLVYCPLIKQIQLYCQYSSTRVVVASLASSTSTSSTSSLLVVLYSSRPPTYNSLSTQLVPPAFTTMVPGTRLLYY